MLVKILLTTFFTLITSICLSDARAGEYRVSPMLIEMQVEPGISFPFQFNVTAVKSGRIKLSLNEVMQLPTGHAQFVSVDDLETVSLVQTRASLADGENFLVQGEVRVPPKSSGSRFYAIIVEEDNKRKSENLQIQVRYAVVLDITIKGRKTRLNTQLTNLQLVDGVVSAWFENLSDKKAMLKSQIVIRDQNKRLIDRLMLRTQSAIERQEDYSIVYPKSKVEITGVMKNLRPGHYNVLVQSQFDEKSLPIYRSEIHYLH